MLKFRNLSIVKKHHKLWFSPETMNFFNSVIETDLIGGNYFVTSERMDLDRPKSFTVRIAEPNQRIISWDGVETLKEALSKIDAALEVTQKQAA